MKDMLGRENVITAERALELLYAGLADAPPCREKKMEISETLGMVCARDVFSPEDLPPFPRSTVDGYAVTAWDTFGATETMPAYLTVAGEVYMGEKPAVSISKGEVCRIPTGGMLPEGSDAVLMFEHVQILSEDMVEVLRPVAPGENVIQSGEDVKKDESIVLTGHRMRPQDIGACAGVGVTGIYVYDRPVVSIISTGDEIVNADETPGVGQVRDINSFVLAAMVVSSGGVALKKGIIRDEYETIRVVIENSIEDSDAVVISGGTSVGTKDMIAKVINDIGTPGVLFHGLSLKPGKPMIGGIIGGKPVFGLPGHPAAVGVCFDLFIRPVLAKLSGLRERLPGRIGRSVKAKLTRNVSSSMGREEHIRVMLDERDGVLLAVPVLGKSGLISTLVKADGVFAIPLNAGGVEEGEDVEVRLI